MNIVLKRNSPLLAFANKFVFESSDFDFEQIKNNERLFQQHLDAAKFDEDLYVACWYVAYGYDVAAYVARARGHTISGMERSKILAGLLARLRMVTAAGRTFAVDQRVIYKIDKNEWYVGTVMKLTPTKVFVKYDDGFMSKTGTPKSDMDLFHFTGTGKHKKPLTDAEAKPLKATKEQVVVPKSAGKPKPAAKTPAPVKTPKAPSVKKLVQDRNVRDMSVQPGAPHEWTHDIMVQIQYSTGLKWKYVHKNTRGSVYVTAGDSVKIKPVDKRHVKAWRAATPEEKKANYESVQEKRAEKIDLVGVKAGSMVKVNYKQYPVWEYCYRVDEYKGTFSVAGGGGKMRDLPLTLALEARPATPEETQNAKDREGRMADRRASQGPRRSRGGSSGDPLLDAIRMIRGF